jgi:hypothetical protein
VQRRKSIKDERPEAEKLAMILSPRLLKEESLMTNANPEESRKIAKEQMKLMEALNLREDMNKPGKNGPTIDSLIPNRNHQRGRNRPR